MARQLIDRITADLAALRLLVRDVERPVDPAAEVRAHLEARARDLRIVLGPDGRVSLADAARLVERGERTLGRWREEGRLAAVTFRTRPRFRLQDLAVALAEDPDKAGHETRHSRLTGSSGRRDNAQDDELSAGDENGL